MKYYATIYIFIVWYLIVLSGTSATTASVYHKDRVVVLDQTSTDSATQFNLTFIYPTEPSSAYLEVTSLSAPNGYNLTSLAYIAYTYSFYFIASSKYVVGVNRSNFQDVRQYMPIPGFPPRTSLSQQYSSSPNPVMYYLCDAPNSTIISIGPVENWDSEKTGSGFTPPTDAATCLSYSPFDIKLVLYGGTDARLMYGQAAATFTFPTSVAQSAYCPYSQLFIAAATSSKTLYIVSPFDQVGPISSFLLSVATLPVLCICYPDSTQENREIFAMLYQASDSSYHVGTWYFEDGVISSAYDYAGQWANPTGLTYIPAAPADPPQTLSSPSQSFATFGSAPFNMSIQSTSQAKNATSTTSLSFSGFVSGNTVTEFPQSWTKTQSLNANDNSTFSYVYQAFAGGVLAQIMYQYNPYTESTTLLPNNDTLTLLPGDLKFTLSISGYANGLFGNQNSGTLMWGICVNSDLALAGVVPTSKTTNSSTTYLFQSHPSSLRFRVPTVALADNNIVPVANTFDYTTTNNDLQLCVNLTFPYFTSALVYDPDMSVLSSPTDNGGDGDNKDWLIAAIVAPVAGAAAFCVLGMVVLIIIVWIIVGVYRNGKVIRTDNDAVVF